MSENDVKIYNSKNDLDSSSKEISRTLDEVMTHRLNGNIDKARKLGEILATITPKGDDGIIVDLKDHLAPKYFASDILYQIKVLLVFAAETVLQSEIRDEILATTAINAMHDKIREDMPVFFRNISSSAAFTFYCLALKKRGDVTENIGEAFAMMCDVQKNTENFVNAGKVVWEKAVKGLKAEITKIDFQRA